LEDKSDLLWFGELAAYCSNRWRIVDDLAEVQQWSAQNSGYPIWLGEVGALAAAPLESRINWYADVISISRKDHFIGLTLLDYIDPAGCNRMVDKACIFVSGMN
jgi:hypothetical protein